MTCTATEASYQRGCRCKDCTGAHRSYAQSRRYRGLPSQSNPVGRPKSSEADKRKNKGSASRGPRYAEGFTKQDIMKARGYE